MPEYVHRLMNVQLYDTHQVSSSFSTLTYIPCRYFKLCVDHYRFQSLGGVEGLARLCRWPRPLPRTSPILPSSVRTARGREGIRQFSAARNPPRLSSRGPLPRPHRLSRPRPPSRPRWSQSSPRGTSGSGANHGRKSSPPRKNSPPSRGLPPPTGPARRFAVFPPPPSSQ